MDPWAAVRPSTRREQLANQPQEPCVLLRPRGQGLLQPGIEAAPMHAQHTAHRAHPQTRPDDPEQTRTLHGRFGKVRGGLF